MKDSGNYRFPESTPTIPDFRLNHPKNYFGYTLSVDIAAASSDRAVASIMTEQDEDGKKITSDISGARAGAHHLHLVETTGETTHLTDLGYRLISFSESEHGSTDAALNELRSFFGTSKLFVDWLPAWTGLTQDILVNNQGIARLVELMYDIHSSRDENSTLPLPLLVQELYHRDRDFTAECFIAESEMSRFDSVGWYPRGSDSAPDDLWTRSLYRTSIVHQLKSMLCHAGILTTKGKDRANLTFSADNEKFCWALTPDFREGTVSIRWTDTLGAEQGDFEEQARDVTPPEHVETTTSRVIRNTALVKTLKEAYDYHCQVCDSQRQRSPDMHYAEGHHLQPLCEGGPDIGENILVLCPTCHADFDYGMTHIDPETYTVTYAYDDSRDGATLTMEDPHTLGQKYIEYHNNEILDST